MSESENLCVEEDAFEKFQEASSYEEDEFITLSDIVDPPKPTLDLNACLDEIQDDICIISETDLQRDENIVSECTVKTPQKLLKLVTIPTKCDIESSSATGSSEQNVQDIPKTTTQFTPTKRGRPRKKPLHSEDLRKHCDTSSECVASGFINQHCELKEGISDGTDTGSNKAVSDRLKQSGSSEFNTPTKQILKREKRNINIPVISEDPIIATDHTSKPRKRGRPRKVNTSSIQQHQSHSSQDDCSPLEKACIQADSSKSDSEFFIQDDKIDNSSNKEKKLSNVSSQSVMSVRDTNQNVDKVIKSRHGRRNKSISNNEDANILEGKNASIAISKQNPSISSDKTETSKSKSKIDNKKYDQIELELLRILSTPTEELEEKCIKEESKNNQKPPKKRGRKQKKLDDAAGKLLEKPQDNEVKQIVSEEVDDDADNMCLSSLKKRLRPEDDHTQENNSTTVNEKEPTIDNTNETSNLSTITKKRNSKKPIMSDFEYNVDTIVNEPIKENVAEDNLSEINNLEIESPSKRPIRRKAKKILHYDEGSDEDPFANVELSDDDDLSGRRGGRYYSDDEYIPGKRKKGKAYSESESSVSGSDELGQNVESCSKKLGKKKGRKSDESLKKNNKSKKNDLVLNTLPDITSTAADTTTQNDDDSEHSLQSPDITTNDNSNQTQSQPWGISHEFENFIAQKIQGTNIQIKKLSGTTSNESAITPLEIPVLDPNEPKKTVEMSTQTKKTSKKTVEVQTTSPYDSTMKGKVALTAEQSEKACEFLKGIVRNTSELGQLMIQKSEDFIQKKINTKNITDTNKMDYCVQKSFLLFKLAKHNLIQMEEDLANEYEKFLESQNMLQYRESPKYITPNCNQTNSDSDCEIVEEPIIDHEKDKEKSKFNLKTVFLNKELSIKIAKKSTEEPYTKKDKVNIKGGRHTVWINDSIMVKKVKPTQSFLAQDSRNKKPPDTYISIEMVRNFFDNYYKRQNVLLMCAPFVSPEWLNVKQIAICNYFIAQHDLQQHSHIILPQSESVSNIDHINSDIKGECTEQPLSLLAQCTKALHKYMYQSTSNNNIKGFSIDENNHHLPLEHKYQPNTLFRLSFNVVLSKLDNENNQYLINIQQNQNIDSLKKLCLNSVNNLMHKPIINTLSHMEEALYLTEDIDESQNYMNMIGSELITYDQKDRNIKSLFSFCVEIIQKWNNLDINENNITFNKIKTLKCIAFENVRHLMYNDFLDVDDKEKKCINIFNHTLLLPCGQSCTESVFCADEANELLALTIKSVNTVSDDIFAKLSDAIPNSEDDDSNFSNYDEYEHNYTDSNQQNNVTEDSNWVSRVQLQELKSCFMPIDDNSKAALIKESGKKSILTSIKIEPLEDTSQNLDPSIVKTELIENDDVFNFNPLETKVENTDNEAVDLMPEQTSSSYDVDAFEQFVSTNKMLYAAVNYNVANDEVFSQSALRVRKQHEPDMDDDLDTTMSLLVPQENTELVKDRLMRSSSDDEANTHKNIVRKKRKTRSKISRLKNKDAITNKNRNTPENEVVFLTRKMQERIRLEQKLYDSSDSELENSLPLMCLSSVNSKKGSGEKSELQTREEEHNQIQCNDVDSTENGNDKLIFGNDNKKGTTMKKRLKMSLRKIMRGNNSKDSINSIEQDNSYVIQPDVPVELLECEPTLPIMHDMENSIKENIDINEKCDTQEQQAELSYIDRHGWKCYPVNNNDTKLYEHTYILLEKLPELFVETYFRYQGVADKNQDDTDINRLTNLQSLHRSISKDNKVRSKTNKGPPNGELKSKDTQSDSPPSSPISNEDHYNEISPSEEEGTNVDDEIASAPPQDTSENVIAKNSLMKDMDSDSEKTINAETEQKAIQSIKKENNVEITIKRYKPGPKSKKVLIGNNSTLLTADKMMNKELALLHAPVSFDTEDIKVKDLLKKPSAKCLTRSSARLRTQLERIKPEEESSSEEEKLWVTTKEKLLKKLVKKQGNSSVDDAKRAKIVSEFIEKRGDATDKRPILRARKGRSRKKFLERKKQMSVLNRELFGEIDGSYAGRKHSQTFGKGRRNIRKVIDKKSLARSTVVANMEEFERKRRLNMQQTRLREQLGCEEGVNVLVINDEVCLEYDFEKMRPVVTIHSFFTKVMKAHQYEGVKFMWDACFESLAMVASGHAGGGCILAHCMGLGKTLQVLALLHTVLTHPGVGMKRVLVCCPLSTVLNWVDEINKWMGPVTELIKVFELSKLKKTYERAYQLEDWYKDGGIFIIGYELFRSLTTLDPVLDEIKPKIVDKIRHALLNPGPDMVICDEGHLLKNDASVLAVAMSRVATRRRIVLTGTPMQNNLREYYCMVNFVKPSLLGTYAEYSNRFENPIMNGQHRDSREEDIKLMKTRTHILHKVLEGCLQRQEASVLYPYLPKKYEYTVFIPPTKCQWDLYKHYIMTYALEQQQQNKQQKQSLLKDFHVLQKIWTHPLVLHNFLMKARDERNKIKEEKLEDDLAQEDLAASEDVKPNQTEVWWLQYLAGGDMLESLESSNKFVVVFQLLMEFISLGDKVLIFSTSLYTMDALEYFLKRINKWSLGQEYFRLDGSVPAEVRQKWCREFNAPHNINTKLFLISTRAGCLGLNMTAANRVIILDTSWNPAHDIQSIFRVYRFGQKKDCYIYRLVAMGTMEQKIYERSVTKQAVSCRVVDEQQIDRHYNLAELTELYRYDEEGARVEAGLAAGISDVALLRVAARARLHAVREHDSLLRGSREQHLPEHERNAAWMQFQQEHANNEMQDRLMEASQGIQRILDVNYAKTESVPIKTENEDQLQPQPASKGKKSKKKAAINVNHPLEDLNISEHKDFQLDAEREEAKVKKIMQLLIKHNFHTSKRADEITTLVANVRSIVDAGGAGLEHCDELTRSIATVMLQEEDESILLSEPPPLSNIIAGDIISNPSGNEVKLAISHEISEEKQSITGNDSLDDVPGQTSEETVNDAPGDIPDGDILNDPKEGSLLVPVMESTRRTRGKSQRYLVDETLKPMVKRQRGRPRKDTSDTEQSSTDVDSKIIMSLRLRFNRDILCTSSGKKSERLMGKPRRSYASDLDSTVPNYCSSKKPSREIDNESKLVTGQKQKGNKRDVQVAHESDVTLIDDEDARSRDSEPIGTPVVREEVMEPEIKKPRRAFAVKSTAKVLPETKLNGKIKRKAALVAEKHLEKLDNESIVTLDDDDDDEWFEDSEKYCARNRSTNKLVTPPQVLDTQKKDRGNTATNNKIQSASHTRVTSEKPKDSSILLSDDDDGANSNAKVSTSHIATNSTDMDSEEPVPLHPSMLSNANFIKIVAYAYQSNRMLDEDAALLAARYSTQKALMEYETTGKCITSGPLYDIAVKVLTKDVLKKLHNKKNLKKNESSVKTKTNIGSGSVSGKRVTPSDDVTLIEQTNPPDNYGHTPAECTSQPKVVPVGMFRGSVMSRKTEVVEESILPDDEDCILGTTNETFASPQNVYKKPNSQQFVIASVKSGNGDQKESQQISVIGAIVPDMVSAAQLQSKISKTVSNVEPFVTITERSKYECASNTPTFRLSKTNKLEPIVPGSDLSSMLPGALSQQRLTLTISEGKLVQPNVGVIDLNASNVTPISKSIQSTSINIQSSSDTICLDSDDEDVTMVDGFQDKGHQPSQPLTSSAITHPSAPTPVAVTTSMPNLTLNQNNVPNVPLVIRVNNLQPKGTAMISSIAQIQNQQKKPLLFSTLNLLNNTNQLKSTTSSKTTTPLPKLARILPKPSDSGKRDDPAANSKTIIRPEDILINTRKDKQMQKLCKAGDIVRITKQGDLKVLSRVQTLPDNMKSQMENTSGSATQPSPKKDPLSILKDVIHIKADEYDEPKNKAQPEQPCKSNYVETNKSSDSPKSQNKETGNKITLKYVMKTNPANNSKTPLKKKTVVDPVDQSKNNESPTIKKKDLIDKKQSSKITCETLDLTNIVSGYNNTTTLVHKTVDKPTSRGSVVVGSSKDIIICTKPSGSTVTKASTSSNNINVKPIKTNTSNVGGNKKRTSPWLEPNSPKRNKVGILRPTQTLEDFDIDDIDDIIELE